MHLIRCCPKHEKKAISNQKNKFYFLLYRRYSKGNKRSKKDFPEKTPEKSCLVAGAGFEPTTFGL